MNGHGEASKALMAAGASLEAKANDGSTALELAKDEATKRALNDADVVRKTKAHRKRAKARDRKRKQEL